MRAGLLTTEVHKLRMEETNELERDKTWRLEGITSFKNLCSFKPLRAFIKSKCDAGEIEIYLSLNF